MKKNQPSSMRRNNIRDITAFKGKTKLVALTAYTAPVARLLDEHVDLLLVGDSLGMVLYGMESTLPVTVDMMVAHGAAVVRASRKACVAVDMPFGSYQGSPETAFNACARVIKETGCQAIKIEGGAEMAETISFLTERAIPVIGHVALMPQHVHAMGGYYYQGRTARERKKIMEDALAVQKAGVFALVLEGIEESLAREITAKLDIVTIGIGASAGCDGQILVTEDVCGLTERQPSFVKRYAELGEALGKAASNYAKEVRSGRFPAPQHCFFKK